jgi:hypothetical protein
MSTTAPLAPVLAALLLAASLQTAEPIVSVWYRGTPAGTPLLDDLAAIRAAGFHAVTWPADYPEGLPGLAQMARQVGLIVVPSEDSGSRTGAERLTMDTNTVPPSEIPARFWRAVARGGRVISFDGGTREGAGFVGPDGRQRTWVEHAVAAARHLSANSALVAALRRSTPGPRFLSLRPVSLEVELFETTRAWVLIATNVGREHTTATVQLPRGVPYAIWVSLLDTSTLVMPDRPAGAEWSLTLGAGEAAVYVIDKVSIA